MNDTVLFKIISPYSLSGNELSFCPIKHLAKKLGRGSQTVNLSKLVKIAKNGGIEPNILTNSGVDSCENF